MTKKRKGTTILRLLNINQYISKDNLGKNLYYILFIALIAVFYIWNTHYTEKTIREINKVEKELKELRWEYMTTKAELMDLSKQSEVAKLVESSGLKELNTPPYKIVGKNEH